MVDLMDYGSLSPPEPTTETASRSVQPFLHDCDRQTDRPTDRPRYSRLWQ